MRSNPAKQAVGDRKHNHPEAAIEMCCLSESLVPQWPWAGPGGPRASQFSFVLPRSREKHAEGLLCKGAGRNQAVPLLPFTTEHMGHEF